MNGEADNTSIDALASDLTAAWVRATGHLAKSAVEANRAALAAYGFDENDRTGGGPSISYSRPEWTLDRTVESPEKLRVGDAVTFSKPISEADVAAFADVSGDTNRLHLEKDFAGRTRFGEPIVHGTLVSGLISAALARFPGLTIYLSQDVKFLAPASIGDRLTATVEITEVLDGDRYVVATDVHDQDDTALIEGEAIVLIDPLPSDV
ncbi:MaoC family dehydratase [Haloferacaceae archaeon DSL9]